MRHRVIALAFAFTSAPLIFAQPSNFSFQPKPSEQPPATITLKDALDLAVKNDPGLAAATTDAAVARQDYLQSRTAVYPTFSGRSEYIGTQGNDRIPTSRYVTNDGVHVYRDWAVAHQDLSPGTLERTGVQRAAAAEAAGPSPRGNCAPRPRPHRYQGLLRPASSPSANTLLPSRPWMRRSALSPSARIWNAAAKWRTAMSSSRSFSRTPSSRRSTMLNWPWTTRRLDLAVLLYPRLQ